jgi:FkbM family methyltransferase
MSRLTRWLKPLVLSHPWLAEHFYHALTLARARRAARADNSFGQCGEDAWFFQTLRERRIPWAESGFYVDLGANHPVVLSATYLLYRHGWSGLTVEPIPSLCALHRRFRPRDICVNMGVGAAREDRPFWETAPDVFSSFSHEAALHAQASGWCRLLREVRVPVNTPAEILTHAPAGTHINYLSIDTEGLDVEILRNWPWETCRPDVVSCEASAAGEGESDVILDREGYVPIRRFPICVFWASPDLAAKLR